MNKNIVLSILVSVELSAAIGAVWSIALYGRNLQTTFKVFLFSFLGGILSAIVCCAIAPAYLDLLVMRSQKSTNSLG